MPKWSTGHFPSVQTGGDLQPQWGFPSWALMNLQCEAYARKQYKMQGVMWEENVLEVTVWKFLVVLSSLRVCSLKEHTRIRLMSKCEWFRTLRVGEQSVTGNPQSFMSPCYSSQIYGQRLHPSVCPSTWT